MKTIRKCRKIGKKQQYDSLFEAVSRTSESQEELLQVIDEFASQKPSVEGYIQDVMDNMTEFLLQHNLPTNGNLIGEAERKFGFQSSQHNAAQVLFWAEVLQKQLSSSNTIEAVRASLKMSQYINNLTINELEFGYRIGEASYNRSKTGNAKSIKARQLENKERNKDITSDHEKGLSKTDLAERYSLSIRQINRVLAQKKE